MSKTVSKELLLFRSSVEACRQRVEKLRYSIAKTRDLFPLTESHFPTFTDGQEESVDALILRYAQCVTMIQEQLFRGIALQEQENINDQSNRDKTSVIGKLFVI